MNGLRLLVDLDGARRDPIPAEVGNRPLPTGVAHLPRDGSSMTLLIAGGEVRLELSRLIGVVMNQQTGLVVDHHLRDPPTSLATTGASQTHRLQVHDSQRFVHTRAREDKSMAEQLPDVAALEVAVGQWTPSRFSRSASIAADTSAPEFRVSGDAAHNTIGTDSSKSWAAAAGARCPSAG